MEFCLAQQNWEVEQGERGHLGPTEGPQDSYLMPENRAESAWANSRAEGLPTAPYDLVTLSRIWDFGLKWRENDN